MAKANQRPATRPQSAFAKAAAGHAAAFNEAREQERKLGGGFELPDIADGEYIAQLDVMEFGVNDAAAGAAANVPFCKISCVVVDHPEYENTPLSLKINIKPGPKSTLAQAWGRVLNQVYGCGYEVNADTPIEELEAIAADATANKPMVYVKVRNGEYDKKRTLNIDFMGAVPPDGDETQDAAYENDPELEPPAPAPRATPGKRSAKR